MPPTRKDFQGRSGGFGEDYSLEVMGKQGMWESKEDAGVCVWGGTEERGSEKWSIRKAQEIPWRTLNAA